MDDKLKEQSDFLTNAIFLTALTLDLMLRESERLMYLQKPPQGWRYEKKKMFTDYLNFVRKACIINEQLISQEVYDTDAKNKYKNISTWQEEANELARSILAIADRQGNIDAIEEIHKFIRTIPGDGIATDDLLDRFRLKKI